MPVCSVASEPVNTKINEWRLFMTDDNKNNKRKINIVAQVGRERRFYTNLLFTKKLEIK